MRHISVQRNALARKPDGLTVKGVKNIFCEGEELWGSSDHEPIGCDTEFIHQRSEARENLCHAPALRRRVYVQDFETAQPARLPEQALGCAHTNERLVAAEGGRFGKNAPRRCALHAASRDYPGGAITTTAIRQYSSERTIPNVRVCRMCLAPTHAGCCPHYENRAAVPPGSRLSSQRFASMTSWTLIPCRSTIATRSSAVKYL